MKIAIIGGGISGLVCGYLLRRNHEVTVFEANDYIGGHTNTVAVKDGDVTRHVDTGFIVFNEAYYPNFTQLLRILDVRSQPTVMSLSVRCDQTGLEYCGKSVNGLFAQRRNLFNLQYQSMLREVLRFQKQGVAELERIDDELTVAEFIERYGYSEHFLRWFLMPMGSALWSAPLGEFLKYPIRFVIQFFRNHGMMQILGRPSWRVIEGGSFRYVEKLCAGWRDRIRLSAPVQRVVRHATHVDVNSQAGTERFDEVIFACHSDQALRMLSEPAPAEREVLGHFPYQGNDTVLHTDTSVMPRNRPAWGAWNYHLSSGAERAAAVTYDMTLLQSLKTSQTYCVSLNEHGIREKAVLRRFRYDHPVFQTGREQAQARHAELIRRNRTSFCGAYWGFGFHEDGVRSAIKVCEAFGERLQ